MALLYYNDPPNAAGTGTAAENAALALQRLRDGNIVNRFTGARVTETQANLRTLFGGTTITTDTEEIIVNSNRSITASGYFVVRDKNIVFNSATARLTANANDVHIAFFNCNITVLNADPWADYFIGGSPNAGGGNAQIPDGRAISGQTSTRGVHFYGCTFSFQTGTTVVGFQCVDMFNSNVVVGRESGLALPSMTQGSRWINVNFQAPIVGDEEIRPQIYDVPELFEGVVFVGSDPELIGRAGPYPITNPDYPANGQTTALLLSNANPSGYSTDANIWQQMGVVTPAGEATANGISRTAGAAARTAYAGTSNNNNGGVIQYYGWNPGYFTDLAQTNGIPFVRVRVGSSAVINTTATGLGQFHNRLSDLSGGEDQTATDINHINEFVTDATGRLVRDANTRRSVGGAQAAFSDGYIDWLDLTRDDTAQTGSTTELARNARGFGAPANTAIAPLFDMRSPGGTSRFDRYQVSFESRSATHDIAETQTIQGNIGTGAGDLAPRTAFPIETPNRTVAPRPNFGSMSEAEAMNRFAAENDKTIQNINDFLIASWARYLENGELNLITQNGSNAVIDYNITFTSSGSATADDNVSVTNQDLTITNVDDIIAPAEGDVITGFTTTGNVTFSANVGSLGTNISCNDLTLSSTAEMYSGGLTVGGNLASANSTFATGAVINVAGNLTAANTTWQDGVTVNVTGTTGIAGATIGTDSTTAATLSFTGTGAITGDTSTTIGDNTMLDGTFFGIQLGQFNGTTLAAGSALSVPNTGTVVLDATTISGTGNITINKTGAGTLTVQVPSAQLSRWTEGTGSITVEALPMAPVTRGFINEAFTSSAGSTAGWFTLFHRPTAGTGTWTEHSDGEQVIGNGATHTFTVRSTDSNANSEWLALWRPADRTASTTAQLFDYTTSFPANAGNETIRRTPIAAALLASTLAANAGDIPSGVGVVWSTSNTGVPRTELFGNITGTDSTGTPLSGAQSQTLMLTAYESKSYFDLYKMHIDTLTGDYILPTSQITTSGDGQFVQLDSGDGAQQNLTAVDDFDADGDTMTGVLTATIMGREGSGATATGREIEFAAVQIVSNPAGATTAQIQGAVGNALGTLPTRAQLRVDMANTSQTGLPFNSDGTPVRPNPRPAD